MTYQEIYDLIKLLNESNLAELRLKDGDFELTLRTEIYMEGKGRAVQTIAPTAPAPAAPASPAQPAAAPAPAAAPVSEKPAEAPAPAASSAKLLEIKSPMVGTFYRSGSPEKPPCVEIGQKVKKGDMVCIIEAMKLFNEIECDFSGTIVKAMVDNAQPVEYDQVLFLVEPE